MTKPTNYPKWKRVSSKTVWDKWMHLVEDEVILPNGDKTSYIYEPGHGAAATLIRQQDKVLLSYQYRYPLDRWIYDLPGGGAHPGETIEAAARRECEEEVGLTPKKLIHLATFHVNPAKTAWPMHVYFCNVTEAADLKTVAEQSSEEVVHKVLLPIKEVEKLIQNGEIVDPSLLIGWYTAKERKLIP
jgi:ADP-ribose pyrophosphatase